MSIPNMKETEPVVKSVISSKIQKLITQYEFKSSWVPPLQRWIVRSIGSKFPFFWTTNATDAEFMTLLDTYCDENGLNKPS